MKFQPPLIGITTSGQMLTGNFSLSKFYVEAIRSAGGVPILIPAGEPNLAAMFAQLDGLVFSGGGDIDPDMYNGVCHPTIYNIDPERDRSEISLAQLALATEIPILGICRGLEILVVATGGSLIPHLPDEFGEVIAHRADQALSTEHTVKIAPDTHLAQIVGTLEVPVVSWHHQAVGTIPSEWRIAAKAPDGVIEALEHGNHPWAIALQWHPEMSIQDSSQYRIFHAFVTAARTRMGMWKTA
ncbi:MAG: putative glutamine amidotransferase [Chroococcidiopsis cubana SAG 39.79]|jgi:putative glutamine amidotransferase|uniref:Peptidase C26 n=2 Tax=Chroococcidiopsis TaxID=54298 RepID=K9TSQ3_CHRTP|nr:MULTISPECIES: gamma-glutamyl-gamma-aminobutyrate hydrolase family protein [Chroococcidiopsis]PSB44546.1 gamma-glutamyl-gamma-aminobutyrate hydrolase family protein [Cyanosarcina cf. burmensis CCALA 770]AFY85837.1 peptidase C26 [Chroococcidiopsis thermalis PCC 7203]MDZ4873036.1 putative glutamine amidotransferase [Chroococcidiopsis cubana SAG 39.79]PSB63909.1 gamma-glutamyl-gamma-aminobutyrate hydrolase family protein [Chroococcidiopsis cubana CCALA 043]RUT09469.1 peptidase C26 [Chroococcidi